MSVELDGMDQLLSNFESFQKDAGEHVAKALLAGGKLVETSAKKLIQEKSGGPTVKRYRPSGDSYMHTVSKGGDAPNTDTGTLVRSIQTEVEPDGVYVGSGVEYAPHLEFGTVNMMERPFLYPSLKANESGIMKLVTTETQKAITNADTN